MILKSEKEFFEHIESGQICKAYLLYGEEDYLVKLCKNRLCDAVLNGGASEFSKVILHETDTLLFEVGTPSFLSSKCVIFDRFRPHKADAGMVNLLINSARETADGNCLIVTSSSDDAAVDGKAAQTAQSVIKKLGDEFCIVTLNRKSASDSMEFIINKAGERGCRISRDAAKTLLAQTDGTLYALDLEMEKLCAYKQGGEITASDVELVVSKHLTARVFELSKQIVRGQYNAAVTNLQNLFFARENEVAILAALSGLFVDMLKVKALQTDGVPYKCLSEIYPATYKGREWKLDNAARDCTKYTLSQLREIVKVLFDTDLALKNSAADKKILLEHCINRIFNVRATNREEYSC